MSQAPLPSASSPDFVNELLGRLQGAGARASSQSSVSSATNVSVNPTIVNNVGGGSPTVTPSIYAPASGSPYATGSSAVQETPSWLSSSPFQSQLSTRATKPGSSPFTSLTAQPVNDGLDPIWIVGGGLAALLLLENV